MLSPENSVDNSEFDRLIGFCCPHDDNMHINNTKQMSMANLFILFSSGMFVAIIIIPIIGTIYNNVHQTEIE